MLRTLTLVLTLLALPTPGLAEPPTTKAQVTLIGGTPAVTPGQPFTVGLKFTLDPGWHIYWQNPGDSGIPPSVTWHLPEGFSAGPLQYPPPHRFEVGPLVNYGYEDEVILLVEITPPANVPATVTLAADVDWLVCQELCIAEKGQVELTVSAASADVEAINAAKASLPQPLEEEERLTYTALSADDQLQLKLALPAGAAAVELFPGFSDQWAIAPQDVENNNGSLTATLKVTPFGTLPPDARQPMLAVYEKDGKRHGVTFEVLLARD